MAAVFQPTVFQGRVFQAVVPDVFTPSEGANISQELRTWHIAWENRQAIIPFENRVYSVPREVRTATAENRKRV